MSVSPTRQARKSKTRIRSEKSAKQGWMKRMLRLEALEQRQLMAADIMPFHNSLVSADVNGDFSISPLDALVVINRLNAQGSGTLAGQTPTDANSFVDSDNDNSLSPLDALVVINAINNGEGVGELAQIRYKFFSVNADGTAGAELPDPNPNDLIPEAKIDIGDRVIVRTQMLDLRGLPQGVFSAYHDLSYTNADGTAAEKLEFQWGEYNQIDIGNAVRGGTFTIKFGTETTTPISPAFFQGGGGTQIYDGDGTGVNIRNALQALPSVGAGNVAVRLLTSSTTSRFGINFIGRLAHQDLPNALQVGTNSLVDGANPPVAVSLTIGQNTADPSLDIVASVARNHRLNNDFVVGSSTVTGVKYINGLDGRLKTPVANSPTRTITLMGGFSDKNLLDIREASSFVNVVDTLFKAAAPGKINLSGDTSPPPAAGSTGNNLGLALYGTTPVQYLASSVVVLPTGILNIAERLTAVTDNTSVAEDSGQTSINVIQNDIDRFGTSRGVVAVTQPSVGGTVSFVNGGPNVTFTPNLDYFGPVVFTYTVRNNVSPTPDTAIGTVSINVTPVNDAPIAVNDTGAAARFVVLGLAVANPLAVMRNDSAGPLELNDTITIVSVTTPTIGTATVNAAGTAVLFTPPAGSFNTTSTFSYTIRDAAGLTSTANVEVFIIPPVLPFALADLATIAEDSGAFTIDVIANDFANTGAVKSLLSFTQPASGTGSVVLDNRGTPGVLTDDRLVYTPPANFFGDALFTYTMNDNAAGSVASTATVTITVTNVNDPPTAADRTAAATEDVVLTVLGSTITNGLSKGPGEDAQTLTVSNVVNQTAGSGTVAVANGNIVYTPAKDFNGQVLVLYTVTDNGVPPLSASATLTINVAAVNDPPVGGEDPVVVTAEDTSATITISSLLVNDRPGPANESSQSVSFVTLTAPINTANGGTVTQVGSTLVYAPAANYNGPDSFSYAISDGQATSNVPLTLRITEVNDAPTATTLTRDVFASVPTIFNLTADLASMPRGPANESGQTLRVLRIVPESISSGRTVVLNADGTITYTAPLGANGRDTFRYEVIDNGTTNGAADPKSSIGTFNVDVLPFIPSKIRGVVYIDDNDSKKLEANELRLGGVEVTLTVPATATAPSRTQTKQTHTDGSYAFDLLPPGVYTVTYAVPFLTNDAPGANSFTQTIVAPGGLDAEFNFSVLGVLPGYSSNLENLASSFYLKDGSLRTSGITAAIGSNGRSEWTITQGGFAGDTFHEVVMSDDGTKAYVTAVRGPTHSVFTATLLLNKQFVRVSDATGAKLVRILAQSSDLSWQQVSLAAPPPEINLKAKAYLDAVDELFIQEKW